MVLYYPWPHFLIVFSLFSFLKEKGWLMRSPSCLFVYLAIQGFQY
jgi:hypothetical protein